MWNYNNILGWSFITEDGEVGRVVKSIEGIYKAHLPSGYCVGGARTLNEAKRLLLLALM